MNIAIFGAQGHALGIYRAFRELFPKRKVSAFLVSSLEGNPPDVDGISVWEIDSFAKTLPEQEKSALEILIATPENVQAHIEELLENYGFPYYRRIGSAEWAEIMKFYYVRNGKFQSLSVLPVGYRHPFIRIYMARFEKDRILRQDCGMEDYVHPVQAGAKNAQRYIMELRDDMGENISDRNGNYSELTVLYWLWKNKLGIRGEADESRQYFGLAQYRRFMEFSEDDLLRLLDNDVDVVMPYPMPYEPNIHAHHKRYLKESDWEAMLQALGELQPEYAAAFDEILEQEYLYNYNVVLARKNVLRDYCAWLFPILARTEELSVPKGCERSDRYIGYMGETLETLYFMKNKDRLNIVCTGCRFAV